MTVSATVRDIAIIIVAMQSLVVGVLLAILIWQIWRLTKMLEIEFKPIIEDTQEAISNVRGTAVFMGDNVVTPVVRGARTVTRARYTALALLRDLRPPRPAPPSSSPPMAPPPAAPTPVDNPSPQM